MNEKSLAVLEKYDIEVLRSWKGRGAILCETNSGIKILKEYKGSEERLRLQQEMLEKIKENGFSDIEQILPSKEGSLLVKDEDLNSYYLKEYREGKECNIREYQDSSRVVEEMAKLHEAMKLPEFVIEKNMKTYSLPEEFEKMLTLQSTPLISFSFLRFSSFFSPPLFWLCVFSFYYLACLLLP